MAIFQRRTKRKFNKKFRETIWPSQGWKRTFLYYRHRVFRTGDSTYRITAGLASGAAVSWSPFIGTHFFQAVFLSWVLRANPLAGFIGTAWGNPWTFPLIFWLGYTIGVNICGAFGLDEFIALPVGMDFDYFLQRPLEFMKYLFSNPLKLLLPMTVGGYICGLLFWPIAYGILFYPVRSVRQAYIEQRIKRKKSKKGFKAKGA